MPAALRTWPRTLIADLHASLPSRSSHDVALTRTVALVGRYPRADWLGLPRSHLEVQAQLEQAVLPVPEPDRPIVNVEQGRRLHVGHIHLGKAMCPQPLVDGCLILPRREDHQIESLVHQIAAGTHRAGEPGPRGG